MTVLLVDIGNTRIKWARLQEGRVGRLHAAVHDGWSIEEYARRVIGFGSAKANGSVAVMATRSALVTANPKWQRSITAPAKRDGQGTRAGTAKGEAQGKQGGPEKRGKQRTLMDLERIVVVSVAGSETDKRFAAAAKRAGAPAPEFVASRRHAAGVTIGYIEPWRLGVDRFVAVLGAHHLSKGRAVCVVGVGTALTIDLVGADGRHWGGAIIPAPQLMVDSLLKHTNGIRRRAQGGASGGTGLFARSTRGAIGQGALYAAAATIDRAVEEARTKLGEAPLVFLTGGGARAVQPLMRSKAVGVPDLVLTGLAVMSAAGGVRQRSDVRHRGRADGPTGFRPGGDWRPGRVPRDRRRAAESRGGGEASGGALRRGDPQHERTGFDGRLGGNLRLSTPPRRAPRGGELREGRPRAEPRRGEHRRPSRAS